MKLPLFILAFVILQGMFGMWTVTLKLWPQVVTAHLLGGFTTLSLLWVLSLRLANHHWSLPKADYLALHRLKPYALAGLLVVVAQVALGGWTTANYAAVACPDLPTCQQQWWPQADFKQGFNLAQDIGPNYLGGTMTNEARVAIHFSHRLGAIITTLCLLLLAGLLLKQRSHCVKRYGHYLLAMLALQLALGLSNIVFHFPLAVAVAHNLGGALLLIVVVTVIYRIYTAAIASSSPEEARV